MDLGGAGGNGAISLSFLKPLLSNSEAAFGSLNMEDGDHGGEL